MAALYVTSTYNRRGNTFTKEKPKHIIQGGLEMKPVIELKGVCKDYGDFKLDNVSFVVPQGCICGFVGQNGAGKTTTIQLMLDVIKRDSGEIEVFETDVTDNPQLKEDIGVVYDEMGFHEFMTPSQISTMMKYIYQRWDEERFFELLQKLSLPSKKKCGAFSRGMRMKLQIAVAMSHHAKLLIMDEPTSGLDPIVRSEILSLFQEYVLEEEHTIFLSSHITSDLEKIADRIVFINGGRIVLEGDKDELLERHGILKCKKGEADKVDDADVVSSSKSAFGVDMLVKDRQACREKYSDILMDAASLDDIMVFYVNRN